MDVSRQGKSRGDAAGWTVFDTASDAFWLLVSGPNPVAVDGCLFTGFPQRLMPLDEVRAALLARGCDPAVRDAVWAHVIERSRAEGGAWTVGCVGLALPGLITESSRLVAWFAGDAADVHAAVLAGFVAALRTVELDQPWIMQRLRMAARQAGKDAIREAMQAPVPVEDIGGCQPPPAPGGHPDLVLARAVADGVITGEQADLIGATRLEGMSIRAYAAERGLSYGASRKARARAERALVAYLTAHDGDTQDVDCVEVAVLLSPVRRPRDTRPPSRAGVTRERGRLANSRRRVSQNRRNEPS